MNEINMIKNLVSKGGNPQQIIMDNLLKNNSNPMITNLLNMAKNGDAKGVENFARNLFKDKGRDFDSEFSNFMKQIR
jgi:hypothetical protein